MIRLNDRELSILRCLAVAPRTQDSFTFGPDPLSKNAVRAYFARLVDLGFAAPPPRQDASYTITEAGLAFLAAGPEIVQSRIWGSASTKEPYVSEISKEPARGAAAMVAFGLPSLGFGA
jgi:hypothetical protein